MTESMSNADLDAQIVESENPGGATILSRVHDFLGRFVAFPSEAAHVATTLWVVHTHMVAAFETTPRLAAMSEEKASGKTRLLEAIEMLVPHLILSISASPAYLVRRVSAGEVTILFDEIDGLFGSAKLQEQNIDVRSILNGGYRRGAKVHRCVTVGKAVETEELDAFAPVALAGLRDLPDTLASRSILIRMKRRAPEEHVEPFIRRKIAGTAEAIKTVTAAWCSSVEPDAATLEPKIPGSITDRAEECWTPLFVVADLAGGDWPDRARAAATQIVAGSNDETRTQGVELLDHIREAFGDEEKLWTQTYGSAVGLLQRLHDRPESPWKDVRGKPLDDRGLAKRLKGYGIKSRDVKIRGENRKGYYASDFVDAWGRYLSLSATSATSATKLSNKDKKVAPVAPVALNGQGKAAERCAHCGGNGTLRTIAEPDGDVLLHDACIDAWLTAAEAQP